MVILAEINNKGGVAKTTTTIHLAASLAEKGYKVLAVDFDPQFNLSTGYKIPVNFPYNIIDFLNGKEGFSVTEKSDNLHVLSGHKDLDDTTRDIFILKTRLKQLKKLMLDNNVKPYDYILIDCPPQSLIKKTIEIKGNIIHIPNLNEIAITASDYALLPMDPEEYSVSGLQNFIDGALRIKEEFNPDMQIAGVFFTKVLVNETRFDEYYQLIKKEIPDEYFFNTYIRKDTNIEKAKKLGKSIFECYPKSRAAIDYMNFCEELLTKIK